MILRFADIEIDTDRYELRRSGEQIDVEPLVFDLLVHFAQHANTLFSRDDLMEAVWSGRVVSDATVSGCIKSVRKALGDSGDKQLYIKTVHGRGFRFSGDVSRDQLPPVASRSSRLTPTEPSLIVLPFKTIASAPDIKGFAEGVVANLETALTRIPLLRINTQTSIYAKREVTPTARQIHEEIGVAYLLEGYVQSQGDLIRVNTQLTDAKSGLLLWAGQFEHELRDIKSGIDGVVISILSKLEPQLDRAIYNSVRTSGAEPGSRELYLEANGVLALKGWHLDTFQEAADLLRKSSALDPAFALAPAYLSLILALGHRVGLLSQREQTRAEAIQVAERALRLENQDSTVLGFVGCAMADLGLVKRSLPILKNAVELNPANAQAWASLGSAYLIDNQPKLAIKYLTQGITGSPLDSRLAVWGSALALALMLIKDMEAAQTQAELACQRDDRTYLARVVYAAVLLCRRDPKAALLALDDAYRIKPDLSSEEIDALITSKLGRQLRNLATRARQ